MLWRQGRAVSQMTPCPGGACNGSQGRDPLTFIFIFLSERVVSRGLQGEYTTLLLHDVYMRELLLLGFLLRETPSRGGTHKKPCIGRVVKAKRKTYHSRLYRPFDPRTCWAMPRSRAIRHTLHTSRIRSGCKANASPISRSHAFDGLSWAIEMTCSTA